MHIGPHHSIEYRGLTIEVWRTDDPLESSADDPEAEGPFEIGEFYCAVVEWNLETGASIPSADRAYAFALGAIEAVEAGSKTCSALTIGGVEPVQYDAAVPCFRR